jgi:hypothetical protein
MQHYSWINTYLDEFSSMINEPKKKLFALMKNVCLATMLLVSSFVQEIDVLVVNFKNKTVTKQL